MRPLVKLFAVAGLLSTLVLTAAAADSVLGVWHGSYRYDLTKLPKSLTAAQIKAVTGQAKLHERDKLTLTMKQNHTFSIVVTTTGPAISPRLGKWSHTGQAVSLQPVIAGQPESPKDFALSKDGRSMTYTYGPTTMKFWR